MASGFPDAWHHQLGSIIGKDIYQKTDSKEIVNENANNKVVENTEVNFKFNYNTYSLFRGNINLEGYNIVKTSKDLYHFSSMGFHSLFCFYPPRSAGIRN
jgi:hypothetical protein